MIDQRLVRHVDLLAADEGRHRDHDRKLRRTALEVVGHRQHGAIAVAHQHDLRRAVEDGGIGLRDVEPAERAQRVSEPGLKRQHQESGDEADDAWEASFAEATCDGGQAYAGPGSHRSMRGTRQEHAASDQSRPFVLNSRNCTYQAPARHQRREEHAGPRASRASFSGPKS